MCVPEGMWLAGTPARAWLTVALNKHSGIWKLLLGWRWGLEPGH